MSEAVKSISSAPPQAFGRYVLHAPIARGGMATIHIARLIGAEGFSRLVAAKRLHPHFTEDPEFVAMFHDEARIASKIHHPNVVPVLDVVLEGSEVIIVQEYVHGVPLDKLFKSALLSEESQIPVNVAIAIIGGVLSGLHAAHETRDEMDEPLQIVHRDVSPQNVMVSLDGIPRLLDFGIAKARSSAHVTREGFFKGKIAYMAPEQLRAENVTRSADVYACGVLLWELLAHRRLHSGRGEAELFSAVLSGSIPTVTAALEGTRPWITEERWEQIHKLEPIIARALCTHPQQRYTTAQDMLNALLAVCPAATTSEVAQWVKTFGAEYLERRQNVLANSEESWRSHSKVASAAAALAAASPESAVKLVARRDGMTAMPSGEISVPSAPLMPIAMSSLVANDAAEAAAIAKRPAIVPWLVSGALLLTVGILMGILFQKPEEAGPTIKVMPTQAVETAPPPVLSYVEPSSDVLVSPKPTAHPPPVAVAAPLRISAPVKAAPPPPSHPAAAPAPAPQPAPAAAPPKADCDPPFYFEGTKKIFKANCI